MSEMPHRDERVQRVARWTVGHAPLRCLRLRRVRCAGLGRPMVSVMTRCRACGECLTIGGRSASAWDSLQIHDTEVCKFRFALSLMKDARTTPGCERWYWETKELRVVQRDNARLREALEWYGSTMAGDGGRRAIAALAATGDGWVSVDEKPKTSGARWGGNERIVFCAYYLRERNKWFFDGTAVPAPVTHWQEIYCPRPPTPPPAAPVECEACKYLENGSGWIGNGGRVHTCEPLYPVHQPRATGSLEDS